ncbi:MAG: N-6 DNA methylase, partial [Nanoarchaeota archaeon]|nr:N-6 DNA methylase [Nanoarchaeota archaeon]
LFDKNYEILREKIYENCTISNIISLPSGTFEPYTNVQTSILHLTKVKRKVKSEKVKFYFVKNDGYSLDKNRKKIIGPLMNSILANALGQPKEKMPKLLDSIFKSVMEKHVLFYLLDDKAQAAVEGFGIAGRIKNFDGDYLHINDSNLGGRKSNLYVTSEVNQEIVVGKDGTIEKTVTITYKNPEKYDGWLNSVLPNWVRVYVPKGSSLIAVEGLEKKYDPYEELGKTVYSGYFSLRPEGVSKVTFKYSLPFKNLTELSMFIQKQSGTDAPLYVLQSGKLEEEFLLNTDKEIRIKL